MTSDEYPAGGPPRTVTVKNGSDAIVTVTPGEWTQEALDKLLSPNLDPTLELISVGASRKDVSFTTPEIDF